MRLGSPLLSGALEEYDGVGGIVELFKGRALRKKKEKKREKVCT